MYTYTFLTSTLLCEGGDAMVPPLNLKLQQPQRQMD